jgi:hypothetical protein
MKNVNYLSGLLLSLFILINLPALASGDHDHHGHDDH